MQKHLATQHAIRLQDCRVFDSVLLSDTATTSESSSSGANETPSAINAKDDDDGQSLAGSEAAANISCRAPLATFTEAGKNKMTEARINECHRAVTRFVVKYGVEKSNLITDLKHVTHAAITADGWTSFSQDHYLTVTLHYVREGQSKEKVLQTRAVYKAQTGIAVAEEIDGILEEFGVKEKVVAATVDNAANMDVAVKTLNFIKFPCFARTLNLGAQKLYNCNTVSNWAARILSVIVWMKRSHMAKVVLKEKQQLLKLPQHMLILDVRTRWNSLYLMMERFCEQFPAIQAAAIDQRLRKPMEKEKLARMGNEDLRKAEEFVLLMRMHYTSTLAVSSEKSPTCGQISPILQKLRKHYTVQADDSAFVRSVKENIWNNLSKRYQVQSLSDM
ncbi:hypothetical protein EPR50_G00021740 [Perca flavescens]|uniref:DUF659 domain-containing protein n=1 Tax=Perca flavescens TaxID=8167 RepID=A0A484DN38_PERFV|nr:hypothetical protein EPR50_G00021740 [Perca flavescens]